MALYFASRGVGTIHHDHGAACGQYTTPASVLLSGLGSDELLGGYSRHRKAFRNSDWDGLNDAVSSVKRERVRRYRVLETHIHSSSRTLIACRLGTWGETIA
jgi:asparagine synthetase B (glutamine-hydrolysing)